MKYETVIGLEVHLHLATDSKAFCGCSTEFGQRPNSQSCPVCMGLPGSLPVLNEKAFQYAIKAALALNCKIQDLVKFDRKNYYYPDLPKNFQISQYDMPLSYDGFLEVASKERRKKIRIRRVHMEEDAGKLVHPEKGFNSLVDYNRSGIPLLEIVTEPDLSSPQEAYDYLTALKAILKYLKVSDCDMEKGSLRCDANISVREEGSSKLGAKVELKNMNSFKGVRDALDYEIDRQINFLEEGGKITQETRLWDAENGVTISMRYKEESEDYRYFPEPDLVPFIPDKKLIDGINEGMPELPQARLNRFLKEYGLSEYDASHLTSEAQTADYFEECVKFYPNPKAISNWITGDIASHLNLKNLTIRELGVSPEKIAGLLKMIDDGAINGKIAKEVLEEMIVTGISPQEIVKLKGLTQISDVLELERIIEEVLKKNAKSVEDYIGGKKNAFMHLVGQVMRQTKGKASPAVVNEILKKRLKDRSS